MTIEKLEKAAGREALAVLGLCQSVEEDGCGPGTIVLLGPLEPGFWAHVQQAAEFTDGRPDPLDRWSTRVISSLARSLGATPLFPFGSPARPFIGWALRSGRAWQSPVGLLVHENAGLMVSFRGALLTTETVFDHPAGIRPCDTCEMQPCLAACPVGALSPAGYDLARCHGYLDQPDGIDCLSQGCAVRRSCPISQNYPRNPEQSAFHMSAFHPSLQE